MANDVAASVRQKLLNLSRDEKKDFQLILIRYASERILYRLGVSKYSDKFILKGALLLTLWFEGGNRATRDIDLLGFGDNSITAIENIFKEICQISENDGLEFDFNSIQGKEIKEDQTYKGVRITLMCRLSNARIPVQIDVGFGDTIHPIPEEKVLPTLLDSTSPKIRCYPLETVVAEKFQAMVALGIKNSRMKDFYDVWLLSNQTNFQGKVLSKAIKATFEKRETPIPNQKPFAFTDEFYQDSMKETQWKSFLKKGKLGDLEFEKIIEELIDFLMPISESIFKSQLFEIEWTPANKWG